MTSVLSGGRISWRMSFAVIGLLAAAVIPIGLVALAGAQPAAVPAAQAPAVSAPALVVPAVMPQKLFYYGVNLASDKAADNMDAVMRRAAKAGYNGFVLAGGSLARIEQMGPRYVENSKRIKKLAEELKLEVIPTVFPLGYSSSILFYDPNLVEGLSVRDALCRGQRRRGNFAGRPRGGAAEFREVGFQG